MVVGHFAVIHAAAVQRYAVQPEMCIRDRDKKAGMHVYKGEKPREEKEKRKERELVNVARDSFGRQTHITYIDLCEQLQQVLDVKERTAKSYIRFMRERDIICLLYTSRCV